MIDWGLTQQSGNRLPDYQITQLPYGVVWLHAALQTHRLERSAAVNAHRTMMRQHSQKLWQAACCLLCLFLTTQALDEPGEAVGGWLTGPLIRIADVGCLLFVLALVLTFVYPRLAAAITVLGCALVAPLWLYLTAPGFFHWAFGGEHHGHVSFVWGRLQSVGLLTLAATIYVCVRGLSATTVRHVAPHEQG